MLKKLIAMTLAFCLMLSMLPVTQVSADTGYSEGLSYTLSDDGTYYIVSGIGDCTDTNLVVPSTYNGLPVTAIGNSAFENCYQLTTVTLPDSITAIGRYAFAWCYELTSINIPNGVTSLGNGAFQQCESLTEIHIPASVTTFGYDVFNWCTKLTQITVDADNTVCCAVDGVLYSKDMTTLHIYPAAKAGTSFSVPDTVTTIDSNAFASCSKLTAITLPEGLLTISGNAFQDCYNLQSIEIPSTVTAIYGWAFSSCSSLTSVTIPAAVAALDWGVFTSCSNLTQILVEEGNANYCSVDGVVYTADMKNLVAYPVGKPDSSFAIPSGVETVYGDAFCGSYNLSEIILPNSMTTIGNSAFECCFGLASIAIPDGVTRIEAWAFSNCDNLTSITIPTSVTYIGRRAFNYCQKLTAVYYAGTQAQWDAITKESDWDRIDWEQEERPFTIYYLGECELNGHSWVDADCENPKRCTSCGTTEGEALGHEFVDDYCTVCGKCSYSIGLYYTLSKDGTSYIVSGIGECADSDLVIPATYEGLPVTAIGDYAFQDCEQLTSVTLPDSITTIGNYAFAWCWKLTSVTLPDSITAIGDYAFGWCYDLTSINIPNGVTTIEWAAFQQCESLTEIHIPASVASIGSGAFSRCSKLTQITVDADNAAYCAVDGVLYTKDMTTLHTYPAGKAGTSFVVPNTVTTIAQYAFASCSRLTEIILPEGLLIIRSNAFLNCYNLKSIDIPSTVTEIDSFAFQNCSGLTSVTIPASVRLLDWGVFLRCSNLTEILVETGNNYFCSVDGAVYTADMKTLVAYPVGKPDASFTIPASTESIHGFAFGGSENLTQIILPASMTSIANYALANCTNLQNVTIPDNVTTIGYGAFQGCESLASIVIPNGVTRIENDTFSNCRSLTSVTIPASVTYIGSYAFNWCQNLKEIRYAGSKAQWDAITKENNWDNGSGDYTVCFSVFCTDGHTWADATCTDPVTCVNCGLTDGVALGHNYVDDICTRCGNYDYNGKLVKIYYPNGQTYVTATANGNRLAVGTASEAAVWTVTVDENGYLIFACNDLYMTSGPNGNQLYMSDTLTDCGRWELTESDGGVLLRNVGAVYNGQYNQYLEFYRAFTTYGFNESNPAIYTFQLIVVEGCEAYGHDWTDATCQETKYCQVCGAEGGNGDHNVVDGVCTLCGIVLSQGLEYTLSDDGTYYIVSGIGTCTDTDLFIPSTYEGLPVTAIGISAFWNCDQLISVTLPNSITTINVGAFSWCVNLTSVNIPNGVTTIEAYAFQDCMQLTSVTLPDSITTIGNYAFGWCYDLTSINIPNGVTTIGWGAFQQCKSLAEIAIPASVTSIGDGAFGYCYSLSAIVVEEGNPAYSVVDGVLYTKDMTVLHTYPAGKAGTSFEIPYGITTINSGAFRGSRNLTGIIIPSSVTTIGDGAFSNCGLTSITIPASVQHIGGSVFENCDSLVEILVEEDNANYCSVDGVLYTEDMSTLMWYPSAKADVEFTIPDGVVIIGQTAFRINNNLQSVIIPNGVTTISFAAFNFCYNLTSITIPDTVTYICNSAFLPCEKLSALYYAGTKAQWDAITKEDGWNLADWDGNIHTFTVYFMGECETNGHTWGEWVITTAPGCSTTGVQTRTCSACGATEEDANVPATGEHTYGQWVVTLEPTTEAAGEETRTCSQCGAKDTRPIAKLVSETDPQIYIESVKTKAGETVIVNVYLKNNPGVMYTNLTLSYDTSVMTLVSVTNGDLMDTMTAATNIVWDTNADCTEDGLLCTLEFQMSENAAEGEYVISATLNEAYNEAFVDVTLAVVSGVVEVRSIVYGDANGDDVVNGKDLMLLRKYMANYNFSTGVSSVEVNAGADANGDGNINGKDLMLLRKYMANYNFSTGESTVVLGPTG